MSLLSVLVISNLATQSAQGLLLVECLLGTSEVSHHLFVCFVCLIFLLLFS